MPYVWDPGEMTWVWQDDPPAPPEPDPAWVAEGSPGIYPGNMPELPPPSPWPGMEVYPYTGYSGPVQPGSPYSPPWTPQPSSDPYGGGVAGGRYGPGRSGSTDGGQGGYPDLSGGALPGVETYGPYGGQRGSGYQAPIGGGTQQTQQDTGNRGGGGGGGGGGAPPDPYAWMAKFGGKDFIKLFLKQPGEKLNAYYARMGGDPVKTLLAKYQELQGMDADMNMRALAIGALGLTGIIDPTTLEEVFTMPQSDYLASLMKAGPSMANYTRFKTPSGGGAGGLRTMKGTDWWSMQNALKHWAPAEAAKPPTITAV